MLRLVGRDNYTGKIQDLKPNSGTTIPQTTAICRELGDRDLVAYSETITRFKIDSAGKALLKIEALHSCGMIL